MKHPLLGLTLFFGYCLCGNCADGQNAVVSAASDVRSQPLAEPMSPSPGSTEQDLLGWLDEIGYREGWERSRTPVALSVLGKVAGPGPHEPTSIRNGYPVGLALIIVPSLP